MAKSSFQRKKVEPITVSEKSLTGLLAAMEQTGFQGKKLAQSVSLMTKMVKDPSTTIFLGYTGSLSTTGQWKMINWLIEHRYIDVLVSTGANISEDIVDAMGYPYWQGSHLENDQKLFREGFNRYYDVYGREDEYMHMTELIADFMVTLDEKYAYSSREFLRLFGLWLWEKGIKSIVATAAKYGVPVFCPAIADSPYGDAALVAKSRGFALSIDAMKDYVEFMSMASYVKDTGVLYIGGGVPKDFIQLFAVTGDLLYEDRKIPTRKCLKRKGNDETYYPHKYAVQITMDSPQWGGLSGCTLEEAMSWGKIADTENHLTCYCEATLALPIITHGLNERTHGKVRKGFDASKVFGK